MTESSSSKRTERYGRAADAPNSLQRWFLVQASVIEAAMVFATALVPVGAIVLLVRGASLTLRSIPVFAGSWVLGTAVTASLMAATGWTKDRAERTVKYLRPFPWSRSR